MMTDQDIEAAATKAGGRWDGSRWVFEDADLHPFVRALVAAERERWCEVAALSEILKRRTNKLADENERLRECLQWLQARHHGGLMRAKIDEALGPNAGAKRAPA